jgi:hypothetical protein
MGITGEMRRKVGAALGVDGEFEPGLTPPASFMRRGVCWGRSRVRRRHCLGGALAL